MQRLHSLLRATAATATFLLAAASAHAGAITWTFSYDDIATSGAVVSASGTLTTQDTPAGGPFLVTGIGGTRNGDALSLVAFGGDDDMLGLANPQLSFAGLSFTDGSNDFNVYWTGTGYRECSTLPGEGCVGTVTDGVAVAFSATPLPAVPEPAPVAMIGVALAALALRARRGA